MHTRITYNYLSINIVLHKHTRAIVRFPKYILIRVIISEPMQVHTEAI